MVAPICINAFLPHFWQKRHIPSMNVNEDWPKWTWILHLNYKGATDRRWLPQEFAKINPALCWCQMGGTFLPRKEDWEPKLQISVSRVLSPKHFPAYYHLLSPVRFEEEENLTRWSMKRPPHTANGSTHIYKRIFPWFLTKKQKAFIIDLTKFHY